MNEERKIVVEEVEAVSAPPRARVEEVESPAAKLERKRDYLDGFLQQKPAEVSRAEPGGSIYDGVIAALKDIFDPEIPVNIYDLGLIYGVDVDADGGVVVTMTLIRTLGLASRGSFNPQDVMLVVSYTVIGFLPNLMNMGLFIA
ncbi:MAG: iron-sulfur cluster assembly protein, partial [Novosphingobium sp.]